MSAIHGAHSRWPDLEWLPLMQGRTPNLPDAEPPEPLFDDEFAPCVPSSQAQPGEEMSVEEQVAIDREVQRLRLELSAVKGKYTAILKTGALHESVLEAVKDSLLAPFPVPAIVSPKIRTGSATQDAILGWADWHAGERVFDEVMGGLNRYDPIITCRRAQATVDTTLELLFEHHKGTTFEHLFVFDLGDAITGDLLEDNKATNALGVFETMRFVAEVKARALAELSAHLPVTFVSVPGNHGRRGQKMPWKQPTETADWLIAEMVALHLADNPRVECIIPRAWSAVVNVRGHNHWLNHGYAAAKGGAGGIPWYAYMRRDGKMTAIEATRGERIDCRWYGHIHTDAEIPKMGGSGRQFIIGSLKGGDEYALNELGEYGDPEQKLVGAHENRTHGVSFRYPIEVKHADDTPSRYEDALRGLL